MRSPPAFACFPACYAPVLKRSDSVASGTANAFCSDSGLFFTARIPRLRSSLRPGGTRRATHHRSQVLRPEGSGLCGVGFPISHSPFHCDRDKTTDVLEGGGQVRGVLAPVRYFLLNHLDAAGQQGPDRIVGRELENCERFIAFVRAVFDRLHGCDHLRRCVLFQEAHAITTIVAPRAGIIARKATRQGTASPVYPLSVGGEHGR
jgi:hypothetical protein